MACAFLALDEPLPELARFLHSYEYESMEEQTDHGVERVVLDIANCDHVVSG